MVQKKHLAEALWILLIGIFLVAGILTSSNSQPTPPQNAVFPSLLRASQPGGTENPKATHPSG